MAGDEVRFRYEGADGTALAGFRWTGKARPRALLQLAHGAGEHAGRYRDRLAAAAEAGFLIYAADHRGHGLTSGMSHLGDFGPGGAEACVSDMARLSQLARSENPDLPLILLGHSMGAIFAQAYLTEHSELIDGLVLSGTTGPGPRLEGAPNSVFSSPRTEYDWLSRDEAEVDRHRRPVLRHPLQRRLAGLIFSPLGARRVRLRPWQSPARLARLCLRR